MNLSVPLLLVRVVSFLLSVLGLVCLSWAGVGDFSPNREQRRQRQGTGRDGGGSLWLASDQSQTPFTNTKKIQQQRGYKGGDIKHSIHDYMLVRCLMT